MLCCSAANTSSNDGPPQEFATCLPPFGFGRAGRGKPGVEVVMGYLATAHDLSNLLAVAGKLRRLAQETVATVDRDLYLTAAAALEARARWMAETLPEDRSDTGTASHRPVDLRI
jgi:hypothetical protein